MTGEVNCTLVDLPGAGRPVSKDRAMLFAVSTPSRQQRPEESAGMQHVAGGKNIRIRAASELIDNRNAGNRVDFQRSQACQGGLGNELSG